MKNLHRVQNMSREKLPSEMKRKNEMFQRRIQSNLSRFEKISSVPVSPTNLNGVRPTLKRKSSRHENS